MKKTLQQKIDDFKIKRMASIVILILSASALILSVIFYPIVCSGYLLSTILGWTLYDLVQDRLDELEDAKLLEESEQKEKDGGK